MSDMILKLSCADRPGLVADVSTLIASAHGNILEAAQFDDLATGRFFMRVRFHLPADRATPDQFRTSFAALAARHAMDWTLRRADQPRKVLILVSKFGHCLGDLLYRQRSGEIPMEVAGIVSNHPRADVQVLGMARLPFHHLPVTRASKAEQEARIQQIVTETGAELVVLARYMQILSDEMAAFLSGRCINIHHSFLPGFKGARPYHQAHARGVKMIGATAHYVTADLDEGPIIHQDVEPVSHSDSPDDMIERGRDIERRVLAHAVALHLQDRILLNGGKTVVFAK